MESDTGVPAMLAVFLAGGILSPHLTLKGVLSTFHGIGQ